MFLEGLEMVYIVCVRMVDGKTFSQAWLVPLLS